MKADLSSPDVCVVVPTYNEVGTIGELIMSLEELGEMLSVRIVIVDDSSTDGTLDIIGEQMRNYGNIILVVREGKLGLGSAIIESFKTALSLVPTPGFIVTMDADLSHDPAEIPALVKSCGSGTLVIGSRYTDGGKIVGWGLSRTVVSKTANLLARSVGKMSVRDCTSGFRCYHTSLIRGILDDIDCDGYDIQIDTLMETVKRGYKVKESPITFQDRRSGESKLTVGDMWKFFKRVVFQTRSWNEHYRRSRMHDPVS